MYVNFEFAALLPSPYSRVKKCAKIWSPSIRSYIILALVNGKNSRHSESLNTRKMSEIDDIFLRYQQFFGFQTYFSKSHCTVTPKIDQFGRKRCGTKKRVKMLATQTNFYKSFFKNILLHLNGRLQSKICSVNTYGVG